MYNFLTLAIKHSALKNILHLKAPFFNSAQSFLIAEGKNKNQPLKSNSFHQSYISLGMVGHACNPSTQEAEAGGSQM
jgi:hypothetical protein